MSENLDVLLEDDEDLGDSTYDLQDDEENALLEDEIDIPGQCNQEGEEEADVLQLDESDEIVDYEYDKKTLENIDESDEEKERNDKFTSERKLLNSLNLKDSNQLGNDVKPNNNISKRSVFRRQSNNKFRGRGRGGYSNIQNRVAPFQQRCNVDSKKVLINPHFKGNVFVNTHTRLAWDNQHVNRNRPFAFKNHEMIRPQFKNESSNNPAAYIQPWETNPINFSQSFNQQPPVNPVQPIYHNPAQIPPFQINQQRVPIHQRLGNNYDNGGMMPNKVVFARNFDGPPQLQVETQFFNQVPMNQPPPIESYSGVAPFHNPPIYNTSMMQYNTPPPQIYNNPPPNYQEYNNQPMYPPQYNNNQPPLLFNNYQPEFESPPPRSTFNQQNLSSRNILPLMEQNERREYQQQERFWNQRNVIQTMLPKRNTEKVTTESRKKKRPFTVSNLHEVPTLPSQIITVDTKPEIEEDEETKAYRKKIEEQKLIRERILRQKEERRKQAAKKLAAEQEYNTVITPIQLLKKPEVLKILPVKLEESAKPVTTPKRKPAANNARTNPNNIQIKINNGASIHDKTETNRERANNFLCNRTVIAKDDSLLDSSIVVVNNLAAGTSEIKLRKLCQGVGDIQKLHLSTKERQATIQFKSVASAHAFFKKYQRYMLDLSMIQVSLKGIT